MSAGSPWGSIQHRETFTRGFSSVSTAGHGGFMLSEKFAEQNLTEAALKCGIKYGGYYCYEEDCDYAIPAFELPKYWNEIFKYAPKYIKNDPYNYLWKTLSTWNTEYLLERGIEPEPNGYAQYKGRKDYEEMRRNNHPDLIVAAFFTDDSEVVRVITADDKEHLITRKSYHPDPEEYTNEIRLSKCVKVA